MEACEVWMMACCRIEWVPTQMYALLEVLEPKTRCLDGGSPVPSDRRFELLGPTMSSNPAVITRPISGCSSATKLAGSDGPHLPERFPDRSWPCSTRGSDALGHPVPSSKIRQIPPLDSQPKGRRNAAALMGISRSYGGGRINRRESHCVGHGPRTGFHCGQQGWLFAFPTAESSRS
jgi:hypothetical protein